MSKSDESARIKELEDLVYIGDHHFPDRTWKARCQEVVADLRATMDELKVARAELEECKAAEKDACDRLQFQVKLTEQMQHERDLFKGKIQSNLEAAVDHNKLQQQVGTLQSNLEMLEARVTALEG